MAYKLKAREGIATGIRRIVVEEIDDALGALRRASKLESVHDARKRVKRIRAVVRLVRGGFSKKRFKVENQRFREIGQRLSDIRDADVLVQSFDSIKPELATIPQTTAMAVERLIVGRRDATSRTAMETGQVDQARTGLREARARAVRWNVDDHGWSTLKPGFERVYQDGRTRFEAAVRDASSERLHAWRKRVKDLMFHIRVLRGVWPAVFESWTGDLDELAKRLGEHHDLSVLRTVLLHDLHERIPASPRHTMVAAIDTRLERAEADARPLGDRLYGDSAKDVMDRLRACWHAWR